MINNNSRDAFNVGILAAEFYCPPYYIDQTELEKYDKVSTGKYTIGLGQQRMAFCSDREDVNSLSLTVFHRLLERYEIDPQKIGRLAVGTESVIDKSKSVSTVLMQILEPLKHWNVCGVDSINACFGGTQALLDAVDWIHSPRCKGRYAVVVMADIAAYAPGPARCTGGAGAVAFLIGPNAPIVLDDVITFHKTHVYDFYKPVPNSEYPVVDGKLSIQCYTDAVEQCYLLYREEYLAKYGQYPELESFAGVCFHAPYCKLVQKSVARLKCFEVLAESAKTPTSTGHQELDRFLAKVRANNNNIDEHDYRNIEKTIIDYSKRLFNEKTLPTLYLAEEIGNMYTSSLYAGLISLLLKKPSSDLVAKNVLMFSYGSGSVAAMFNLKIVDNQVDDYNGNSCTSTFDDNIEKNAPLQSNTVNKFNLKRLIDGLNNSVSNVLKGRIRQTPEVYAQWMDIREGAYGKAPYEPTGRFEDLQPSSYYLSLIDCKYRRFYEKTHGKINPCPEQNGY